MNQIDKLQIEIQSQHLARDINQYVRNDVFGFYARRRTSSWIIYHTKNKTYEEVKDSCSIKRQNRKKILTLTLSRYIK